MNNTPTPTIAVQFDPTVLLQPSVTIQSRNKAARLLTASLHDIEQGYQVAVQEFSKNKSVGGFVDAESYAFARNRIKILELDTPAFARVCITYFKEMQGENIGRMYPQSITNQNGEDSIWEILNDVYFLVNNSKLTVEVLFINDVIGEKQEDAHYDSAEVTRDIAARFVKNYHGVQTTYGYQIDNIHLRFVTLQEIASLHNQIVRFEDRDPDTGKIRERKGGGVLAGLETPELEYSTQILADRKLKVCMDADRAYKVGTFLGDAVHAIVTQHATAYLADLNHADTINTAGGTRGKRKIFFSGLVVQTLFPDLTQKYHYTGTTQVPAKAFGWDMETKDVYQVRPNIDLALINAALHFAKYTDRDIAHGPVINIDNAASSTMSMSDTVSEWEKTYGPIFQDAGTLAEANGLDHWLVTVMKDMTYDQYTRLFYASSHSAAIIAKNAELFEAIDALIMTRNANQDTGNYEIKTRQLLDELFAL